MTDHLTEEARRIARSLTKGARRATLLMSTDWQFCGRSTFDQNGAHNAYWKGKGAIERDLLKDGKWSRWAYRLADPLALAVRAILQEQETRP